MGDVQRGRDGLGAAPQRRAPLVAITGRTLEAGRIQGWRNPAVASPKAYADAVERAGASGAVLPPVPLTGAQAAARLEPFDGLVLTGGADVNPELYGEEPRPEVYGVDAVLDQFEIALARASLDAGLPLFAVCRGMQVLNVAMGGTLDQHITGRPGLVAHGHPNGGPAVLHEVRAEPGSVLAKAMGAERATVMSHHHQAVGRLAEGAVPVAWSDDGLLEAFEVEVGGDGGWAVAVQWHPEETADRDPTQQALFDSFVAAL